MPEWNPDSPEERRKRTAWSVATSCAVKTGENPVDIYSRILDEFKAMDESNESK
jgi:transcription elongation factor Elf1